MMSLKLGLVKSPIFNSAPSFSGSSMLWSWPPLITLLIWVSSSLWSAEILFITVAELKLMSCPYFWQLCFALEDVMPIPVKSFFINLLDQLLF